MLIQLHEFIIDMSALQ